MRERGDLDVLHEPFMYDYYLRQSHRRFANFEPEPDHPQHYDAIKAMIVDRARSQPVFFKDMAYYIVRQLPKDPEFIARMVHCFLIRPPEQSIVSYHRRDPQFSQEETGLEAQWILYNALVAAGQTPIVIRASDLCEDPRLTMTRYWQKAGLSEKKDALNWEQGVPTDWQSVQQWHSEVINSNSIRRPEKDRDHLAELAALGEPYTDFLTHHQPFYNALNNIALEQKAHDQ